MGTKSTDISANNKIREGIIGLENTIKEIDGAFLGDNEVCPLKHTFADGIYVREIFIPKGMCIVGKIHKHSHPNFLMKGTVNVVTEFGSERIEAPCSMISKAGTKRALYAETDLIWVTVHSNVSNTQDIDKIEDFVIAESYGEYQKFIQYKDKPVKRFINKIINQLNIF